MSPVIQVTPRPSIFPRDSEPWVPTNNDDAAGPRESALEDCVEDYTLTINDVESLQKGIIKTSKNKGKEPYTIILLGEAGVGKSSFLELIANAMIGKGIDHYNPDNLDDTNEQMQSRSNNQSQANSARLYELTSSNGILVRILDTPGLASSPQQDEQHKKSIATQIKKHIDSATAILVFANGTVPRGTVGIDHALSTLSAMFPKPLTSNTGFILTNISSPLSWNFCQDTVPDILKCAPQFRIDNPVALQKRYLQIKDDPQMRTMRSEMRSEVKAAEEDALRMLVNLFDWLDSLRPQPTSAVVSRYEKSGSIVTNVIGALAKHMVKFVRKLKKVEAVRKVKRIFFSE